MNHGPLFRRRDVSIGLGVLCRREIRRAVSDAQPPGPSEARSSSVFHLPPPSQESSMEASPVVHPSEKTLRSYALGKLDDHQAQAVNRHLKDCAACQSRVAEMTSDTFLGRLRDAHARPGSVLPVGSSIAGISKLDAGSSQTSPPPAQHLASGSCRAPGLPWRTGHAKIRRI